MPSRYKETEKGKAVLTAIDKSIVILSVCLCAITRPLELDGSNTFRTTGTVEVKCNCSQRTNGGVE
jgi:hypothetical protein